MTEIVALRQHLISVMEGRAFRPVNRADRMAGERIGEKVVWQIAGLREDAFGTRGGLSGLPLCSRQATAFPKPQSATVCGSRRPRVT